MSDFNDAIRRKLLRKDQGKKQFLQLVEHHQKAWGHETYKGKPSLEQIMSAKVVAFWMPTNESMYLTVTLHKNLDEINLYLMALVQHSKTKLPVLRLAYTFVDQIPRRVKEVRIVWE